MTTVNARVVAFNDVEVNRLYQMLGTTKMIDHIEDVLCKCGFNDDDVEMFKSFAYQLSSADKIVISDTDDR